MNTMRTGLNHSPIDSRTLVHATYRLEAALPDYPQEEDWSAAVPDWPMYKNDELGICGPAGAAHMIQSWTAAALSLVTLPDEAVLQCYRDVGGYIDGRPSTDQGVCLLELLKYWQTKGIGGHQIGPFVRVDATRPYELCEAHHLYVGLLLGLDMPLAWQDADVWDVAPDMLGDWGIGTWGGHCVTGQRYVATVVDVSPAGLWVVTWGKLKLVTWAALAAYCSEAYGILSKDYLTNGKSPIGLDYSALAADLALVQQMQKPAAIAYKAIPIPACSFVADTVLRITPAYAQMLADRDFAAVGRYLGGLTPQEMLDITAAKRPNGQTLGLFGINYSRKNGWLPSASLGSQDGARDVGQAKALSFPPNSTIFFDCEGCGVNPKDHIKNWGGAIVDAKIKAGCYADGQDKMTGVEFGAVSHITSYWDGAAVGTMEPLYRGWAAIQTRPVNVDLGHGLVIDRSVVFEDSHHETPTMIVRA